METKFNFKSQVCTSIEQSRRLLELGLKKETADMRWERISKKYCYYISAKTPYVSSDIPAWSLHRLIEMYVERYISCSMNLKDLTYEWIINEIEIHIKEGDFNKEYLV
jgi:hypothetical protein